MIEGRVDVSCSPLESGRMVGSAEDEDCEWVIKIFISRERSKGGENISISIAKYNMSY